MPVFTFSTTLLKVLFGSFIMKKCSAIVYYTCSSIIWGHFLCDSRRNAAIHFDSFSEIKSETTKLFFAALCQTHKKLLYSYFLFFVMLLLLSKKTSQWVFFVPSVSRGLKHPPAAASDIIPMTTSLSSIHTAVRAKQSAHFKSNEIIQAQWNVPPLRPWWRFDYALNQASLFSSAHSNALTLRCSGGM